MMLISNNFLLVVNKHHPHLQFLLSSFGSDGNLNSFSIFTFIWWHLSLGKKKKNKPVYAEMLKLGWGLKKKKTTEKLEGEKYMRV